MFEKEAEEKYFNHEMADFQGFYNRHYYCLGYLESAEPREKRIAELEKENAELTKAKEILRKFLDAKSIEERCVAESEAEHFLNGEVYL